MIDKTQSNVAWGVEFGGSAVRLVRVVRTGAGYQADRCLQAPLEDRWESGPDVAAAVAPLAAAGIADPLVACVSDELILYRALSLPNADPDALAKMVAGQLEVLIPTEAARFALPWCTQADPYRPGHQRVLLAAARRDALTGPAEACSRLGRDADGIVPSALALATAWSCTGDTTGQPAILLDVGTRCTTLAVTHDGQVVECAVLDNGGDRWTERIAEQLGISPSQAEQKKLAYAADPSSAEEDPAVYGCIQVAMDGWARQLREVVRDCLADIPPQGRPKRCILFGRSAHMPGLPALVAATLEVQVQAATAAGDRLTLADGVDFDTSAAAIGAALCVLEGGAQVVNLAADTKEAPPPGRKRHWRWAALAAWLLLAVASLYGLDRIRADSLRQTLRRMRAETSQHGGLKRQLAVGEYLELSAPSALDVLDRIGAAESKAMLAAWHYNRSGNVVIAGTVANEQECSALLEKLSGLGEAELKSGRSEEKKFRFEIGLKVDRSMKPAPKPAQPTTKPTSQPASGPASGPASAPAKPSTPATGPATVPASGPGVPAGSPPTRQPAGRRGARPRRRGGRP